MKRPWATRPLERVEQVGVGRLDGDAAGLVGVDLVGPADGRRHLGDGRGALDRADPADHRDRVVGQADVVAEEALARASRRAGSSRCGRAARAASPGSIRRSRARRASRRCRWRCRARSGPTGRVATPGRDRRCGRGRRGPVRRSLRGTGSGRRAAGRSVAVVAVMPPPRRARCGRRGSRPGAATGRRCRGRG